MRRSWILLSAFFCLAAAAPPSVPARLKAPFASLRPAALIRLGKTADWVAVTDDAVWVASTGPFAAHRIDLASNRVVASVALPGEPCAGLAAGFGSCGRRSAASRASWRGST